MKRYYCCILSLFLTMITVAQAISDEDKVWFHSVLDTSRVIERPPRMKPIIWRSSIIRSASVREYDSPDIVVIADSTTTQSENSVFIDPNNPLLLLNSNNSSDWPVTTILGADWWISTDGGQTWSGSINGAGGQNKGDPATAIDLNGRMYVGYISLDRGQGVAWSPDTGATWTHVQVGPAQTYPDLLDKNHLWVDNSPTSPYVGNLYSAWMNSVDYDPANYEIEIVRSTDSGLNWSTPTVISDSVSAGSHNQGVNIQTGSNGDVYVVWTIYDGWPADETALGFSKSTDGGASWSTARRIITNIRGHRNTPLGGGKTMRHNSFPSMTVNQQTGEIFVAWTNIGVPGVNTGDPDIYLSSSVDGGTSWGTAIRVNQDTVANDKDQYFPWIACDPTTGILACIFYDCRNFVDNDMVETFVAISHDAGQTWEDFRVSDAAWSGDALTGFSSYYAGDYLGIASRENKVYPMWSDDRTGNMLVYISPFEVEPTLCGPVYDGNGGPLASGVSYLITCDVEVPSGQTLTIQPGAEVFFNSGFKIIANGTLNANGALANPIKLFSKNSPHRGMKLMTSLVLQNGEEFKPGD